MSKTRYNFKRIPAQCLIDIYTGLSLELKKQPFGKRNFRRALVSWKDTGALHKLHRKYPQFTSAKNKEVDWKHQLHEGHNLIPYNRIQEIYNTIREKWAPLGNPQINLWNKGEKAFDQYNKDVVSAIKKGTLKYKDVLKWKKVLIKKSFITLDDGTKLPTKFYMIKLTT